MKGCTDVFFLSLQIIKIMLALSDGNAIIFDLNLQMPMRTLISCGELQRITQALDLLIN